MLATGFIAGTFFMWIVCMSILELDDRAMLKKAETHQNIQVKNKILVVMHKSDYDELKARRQADGEQSETINVLI